MKYNDASMIHVISTNFFVLWTRASSRLQFSMQIKEDNYTQLARSCYASGNRGRRARDV